MNELWEYEPIGDELDGFCFWMTKFRVICPECGHVSSARWTREPFVVACRGCSARFDYRQNTYRPVTGDMTDEERAIYAKDRQREYDSTPQRKEHNRGNAKRYYRNNREKVLKNRMDRYYADHEASKDKNRRRYERNKEAINARRRELYALRKLKEKI